MKSQPPKSLKRLCLFIIR